MSFQDLLSESGGYTIDANNQFKIETVRKKISCGCGYLLAIEGEGATMVRSSVSLVDYAQNRLLIRCPSCKKITAIEKGKKRLTV